MLKFTQEHEWVRIEGDGCQMVLWDAMATPRILSLGLGGQVAVRSRMNEVTPIAAASTPANSSSGSWPIRRAPSCAPQPHDARATFAFSFAP